MDRGDRILRVDAKSRGPQELAEIIAAAGPLNGGNDGPDTGVERNQRRKDYNQ